MNAGTSGAGQAFAMRNCDAFFTSTGALRLAVAGTSDDTNGVTVFDRIVQQVHRIKDTAREFGRDIEVFTQGQVICRPTQREAEDYHRYANVENADWPAIEQMLALKNITPQNTACGRIFCQTVVASGKRDRRLSVRWYARQGRRGVRRYRPCRCARHRGLVRELPQRGAVFLRRGATPLGAAGA